MAATNTQTEHTQKRLYLDCWINVHTGSHPAANKNQGSIALLAHGVSNMEVDVWTWPAEES